MDPRDVLLLRRPFLVAFVATVVLVLVAATARGEEAFVLDNGSVIRGNVLREDGASLEILLTGRGMHGTVAVDRSRIVQRFVTVEPEPGAATPLPRFDTEDILLSRPATPSATPAPRAAPRAASPVLKEEGRVERFLRRATASVPPTPGAHALVVSIALAVLTALVALGARMAEIDDATLGRCTVVAFLLGGFVAALAAGAHLAIRTEFAALAFPFALLAWAGMAAAIFRCGYGRAFTLLAFVLVSGSLVLFTTGVVVTAV